MTDRCCQVVPDIRTADGGRFYCWHPINHEGPCRPNRSAILAEIEHLDSKAEELSRWVVKADERRDLWPYEGPR